MIDFVKSFLIQTPILIWLCVLSFGITVECLGTNSENMHSFESYWLKFKYMLLYLVIIFLFLEPLSEIKDKIYVLINTKSILHQSVEKTNNIFTTCKDVLLLIIVSDFFSYWWHRSLHSYEWLWDMHAVHHSDDAMNVLTGVRAHWTAFMFELFSTVLPASVILGPNRDEIYALTGFITSLSLLSHSNVKLSLGKYSSLIVGPQFHRIHHSLIQHHHNKNYAAIFPIWDIIFGTYYQPQKDEYPPTGVLGLNLNSIWTISLYPIYQWYHKIRIFLMEISRILRKENGKRIIWRTIFSYTPRTTFQTTLRKFFKRRLAA